LTRRVINDQIASLWEVFIKTFILILLITNINFAQAFPRLYFKTSGIFHSECQRTNQTRYHYHPEWLTELNNRQTEIEAAWNLIKDHLTHALLDLTGKQMQRKEMDLLLHVCGQISMSTPLSVKTTFFLNSYARDKQKPVEPLYGLSVLILHELLHNFLIEQDFFSKSQLLKSDLYKNMSNKVKLHLHLMAIQRKIYLYLRMPNSLTWAEYFNVDVIGGDYKTTWEIIKSDQVMDAFVNEISHF